MNKNNNNAKKYNLEEENRILEENRVRIEIAVCTSFFKSDLHDQISFLS